MSVLLSAAQIVLFAVFAVAGVAKLVDRTGTRTAVAGFGVPDRFASAVALAVPFAELAIAAALLPETTAWFAAVAAIGLLTVFLAAIGYNLAVGRRPPCNCFGQIHSTPVGPTTVALNVGLLTIAGLIVWRGVAGEPASSLIAWIGLLSPFELAELAAGTVALALLTALAALMWQMIQQQGRILLRFDELEASLQGQAEPPRPPEYDPLTMGSGLDVGAKAPAFELTQVEGRSVSLEQLLTAEKPILLVFANPHCGPCEALLPEVAQWQRGYAESFSLVVISEGNKKDNRKKIIPHGLNSVLLQREREIADAYQAWGTPAAMLIGRDGAIASRVAQGAESIRSLVAWAVQGVPNRQGASPAVALGQRPPSLELPDLSGATVNLANVSGPRTMLLFWNPDCGFCQQMLDPLKAWEASRSAESPELLVISSGSVENNRAMKLRAPVLLDPGFKVAPLFGANGTPMAVMLDENGQVSSEVAGGADMVFALANSMPAAHARAVHARAADSN